MGGRAPQRNLPSVGLEEVKLGLDIALDIVTVVQLEVEKRHSSELRMDRLCGF